MKRLNKFPPQKATTMTQRRRIPKIDEMNKLSENANVSTFRWLVNKYYEAELDQHISLVKSVIDKVSPFVAKPSVFAAVQVGLGLIDLFSEKNSVWSDCYFDNRFEWCEPFSSALIPLVVRASEEFPYEIIRPSDNSKSTAIKVVDFDGAKVGWNVSVLTADLPPMEVHVQSGMVDHVKQIIKERMWAHYEGASLVLDQKTNMLNNTTKVDVRVDALVNALPSATATRHATNFRRAFEVNEHRSLFLYGPPGSGKSTMARQIAKELDLRSIRLKVECLNNDSSVLQDIVDIFQPGCIIIDDFDRSDDPATQLDLISHIRKTVPLIIATANDRNALDEALLRPERFDELEFIKQLDENVVKNILGTYVDEAYETVKDWPIVFVSEYVRRRKWQSNDDVVKTMVELSRRIKRLSTYDDDDDNNQDISRLLRTKAGKKALAKLANEKKRSNKAQPESVSGKAVEEDQQLIDAIALSVLDSDDEVQE